MPVEAVSVEREDVAPESAARPPGGYFGNHRVSWRGRCRPAKGCGIRSQRQWPPSFAGRAEYAMKCQCPPQLPARTVCSPLLLSLGPAERGSLEPESRLTSRNTTMPLAAN